MDHAAAGKGQAVNGQDVTHGNNHHQGEPHHRNVAEHPGTDDQADPAQAEDDEVHDQRGHDEGNYKAEEPSLDEIEHPQGDDVEGGIQAELGVGHAEGQPVEEEQEEIPPVGGHCPEDGAGNQHGEGGARPGQGPKEPHGVRLEVQHRLAAGVAPDQVEVEPQGTAGNEDAADEQPEPGEEYFGEHAAVGDVSEPEPVGVDDDQPPEDEEEEHEADEDSAPVAQPAEDSGGNAGVGRPGDGFAVAAEVVAHGRLPGAGNVEEGSGGGIIRSLFCQDPVPC